MNGHVSEHRENILKTAKALVEDTKTLVAGAASSQEQLAVAAQNAVTTIVQLSEVVKSGAASLGAPNREAQVMLINAVKDVASALGDLMQSTKSASGKGIQDPAMHQLKDSAKVSDQKHIENSKLVVEESNMLVVVYCVGFVHSICLFLLGAACALNQTAQLFSDTLLNKLAAIFYAMHSLKPHWAESKENLCNYLVFPSSILLFFILPFFLSPLVRLDAFDMKMPRFFSRSLVLSPPPSPLQQSQNNSKYPKQIRQNSSRS